MADIMYGTRLMKSIAGIFPCQALLHRRGKSVSQQCLLCRGEAETISHIQYWCPALKEARIVAHHALAAMLLNVGLEQSLRWQVRNYGSVTGVLAAVGGCQGRPARGVSSEDL